MPTYNLHIDIEPLVKTLSAVDEIFRINIANAVAQSANIIENEWKTRVKNAPGVWQGEKDAYIESIKTKEISPFEFEIYSDYKIAAEIETGRPARDLKRMLDTSAKVRFSVKTGTRYLIIPMRHNVSSMPPDIYSAAKNMGSSSVTGQKIRLSGLDAYNTKAKFPVVVPQNVYNWGGRLGGVSKKTSMPDNHAGMVRMNTSSGNSKSSAYLTFRVMSERSNGWIIPAKPGLFLVRGIVEEYQPIFEKSLADACLIL